MKTYIKGYMAPIGCAMMLAAASSFGQAVSGSVTVPAPGGGVTISGGVTAPDDYVYYPAYGMYYSKHRHQYGYEEGGSWIWRATPPNVAVNVVQASPSVQMDWHDSPALHHRDVVKRYPKDWRPVDHGDHRDNGR